MSAARGLAGGLFATLLAAKWAVHGMAPTSSLGTWLLACADDALVVATFAALAWRAPRWAALAGYAALCAYAALNVLVTRAVGTPLVAPMLRGVDSAMSDSAARYLALPALAPALAVLAVALLAPRGWRRAPRPLRFGAGAVLLALVAATLWPRALHPAQRNALAALVRSALPTTLPKALPTEFAVAPAAHAATRTAPAPELTALREAARGRSVVLVVLESAAPRFLGAYGAARDAMPFVSSLAARALLCTDASAVYPESIKGQIALLHSAAPAPDLSAPQHGRVPIPGLPELLAPHGYASGLFHAGRFRFLGMHDVLAASGFATLADAATIGGEHESSFGVDEESTVAATLAWVDTLPRAQPFFAAYLPVAGHHPYASPPSGPFPNDNVVDCYRNALHYCDRNVRALWQGLCQRRDPRELLLCVVGDHGQAFGEHPGNFGHTFALYQENLAVPLLWHVPGVTEAALRCARVVSHLDVAPTLLDLLGLPACAGHQGSSLLQPRADQTFAFTDWGEQLVARRDGDFKSIHDLRAGTDLLFDLRRDPGEQVDLAAAEPARCAAARAEAKAWLAATWATVRAW